MASVIKNILFFSTIIAISQAYSWDDYYDIDEINEWLREVASENPNYIQLVEAGVSYEGRPLLGLKISSDLSDTSRQIVMLESGNHGREWEAPASTTYFIDQLLHSNNKDILALKDLVEWQIFPSVNPDSLHYSHVSERFWRKTRSPSGNGCFGADFNRNWDYHFGGEGVSEDPCDYLNYLGSAPFSEIETKSLSEYITSISNRLVSYVSVLSLEQSLYIPYGDNTEKIPDYDSMVQVGKVMLEYAKTVNGTEFVGPASAAAVSYPASGMSMDWVYKTFTTPLVFMVELRGFEFPRSFIALQGDEFTQMMLGMITEANNIGIISSQSSTPYNLKACKVD